MFLGATIMYLCIENMLAQEINTVMNETKGKKEHLVYALNTQ